MDLLRSIYRNIYLSIYRFHGNQDSNKEVYWIKGPRGGKSSKTAYVLTISALLRLIFNHIFDNTIPW